MSDVFVEAAAAWNAGVDVHVAYQTAVIGRVDGFEAVHEDLRQRRDTSRPLDPAATPFVAQGKAPLRVLDVGSGASPSVGWTLPGRAVQVTSADPFSLYLGEVLAYARFPETPDWRVQSRSEVLRDVLSDGSFDLVFMNGALGLCHTPPQVVDAVLSLLAPGGAWVSLMTPNAAEAASYYGIQQWNVEQDGADDVALWRPGARLSLATLVAGRGALSVDVFKGRVRTVVRK